MASDAEVAVFIDTNLGTHFAMAVSPDTIVGVFQRELETTHHRCFPKLGEIKVYALMVKRKSCFYHLPSSMPMKYAFQHQGGTRFLYIEVRTLKDAAERNWSSMTKNRTDNSSRAISSTGIVSEYVLEGNCSRVNASSPSTIGAIQGLPEEELRTRVDDCCSNIQIGESSPFMVRTPPKLSSFQSPADGSAGPPRNKSWEANYHSLK